MLWGGTHALRTWWGILLLAGLIALGVVALRRQTLQEFPPGATNATTRCRPPDDAVATARRSPASELARLVELHASGALSDDEFAQAKRIALT